jgi:hypothetical protein
MPQVFVIYQSRTERGQKSLVHHRISFVQIYGNYTAQNGVAHKFNSLIVSFLEGQTVYGSRCYYHRLSKRGAFRPVHIRTMDAGLSKEFPVVGAISYSKHT